MSNTEKRTLASLFAGELRLADLTTNETTCLLYIENMVNSHVLAITVSIPIEVADEYDLTIS
jgi:hypothetical protein